MYNPPHFKIDDKTEQDAFIKAHPFATLISNSENGLFATHLPLTFKDGVFYGHIAKANLHKNLAGEALVILQGEQGYISPNHYPTKQETHKVVPTWNYEAMHIYGALEFNDEAAFKLMLVTMLTKQFEEKRAKSWAVSDAPHDYIEGQLKGIIGFTFTPSRYEFKVKMSQNRQMSDRLGVIDGLENEHPALSARVKSHLPQE